MIRFTLNESAVALDADPDTPLLWALRDGLGLTGAKYGCGAGLCGACLVHVEGAARPACVVTLGDVEGRSVVTIEGLGADRLHPVQDAWIELGVPQCGYCQSGQIMAAAAALAEEPRPTPERLRAAVSAVLCRCGAYQRIEAALGRALSTLERRR